ncbi:MAG: phosphate signaling complex protein PhoU [Bacilli bacterium]|nr:phosphate signaling complex protein PhoU [Bacilli bacterium]
MLLDQELDYLNQMLLKMADQVQKNILEAFLSYKTNDDYLVVNDDVVDQYERLVEEICLNLMLKERLYARDLKKVTGILKMVSDLERIGDHAEDIMELNIKYHHPDRLDYDKIENMVTVSMAMVQDAIKSFVHEDLILAQDVIARDNQVDNDYEDVIQYIVESMTNQKAGPELAIYTTLVVKYIERIADHAVNIAEWAIYIINGVHKDKRIF